MGRFIIVLSHQLRSVVNQIASNFLEYLREHSKATTLGEGKELYEK